MEDVFSRFVENMVDRVTGPMTFRVLLQPAMATLMAIRDGLQDARTGKPPYSGPIAGDPAHRRELLRDGWKSVAKIFVLAFVLDVVYQWIALRWFYPGEALLVAILLAIAPYLIFRGLVNRLTRSSSGAARGASRP